MAAEVYLYALLAGFATLFGGLLLDYTKLKNVKLRYLIGFSSGVLIVTALLDMIPHLRPGTLDYLALTLGFFTFYFIEKVLMIHACGEEECTTHSFGWIGVVGLSLDNFVDGAAIATGYFINPAIGLTIALAVAIHEIPQGVSTNLLMKREKFKKRIIYALLLAATLLAPLGVFLSNRVPNEFFLHILAFSAGSFIYVGASDMLPEAHERFNWKVVASVILGALLMFVSVVYLG